VKLAEALLLRGDLQKKLASLQERIGSYAAVQEGTKPAEDPNKLLAEANGVVDELADLVFRINRTNLSFRLGDGRPLTQLLAQRDAAIQHHSLLKSAIKGSTKSPDRYGLREIKWVAVVDVRKLQKQADDAAARIRELNGMIQEANWKIELEE
jgi:hypothetical protein